jgi:hypothetical protein
MKRLAPVFLFILLLSTSLACMTATRLLSAEETPTPTFIPSPTDAPATATPAPPTATPDTCPNGNCIMACVDKLGAIAHPASVDKKAPRRIFSNGEEYTLITYDVNGDQIVHPVLGSAPKSMKPYQDDKISQKAIWDYFAAIIPNEERNFLTHYVIFTDGKENILASVAQSEKDAGQWDLNVDILDTSDPKDLTYTLVHEFGHLLTLNPDQVTPSQAIFDHPDSDAIYDKEKKACPEYFPGEGCSHKNAYINLFVHAFWNKIYAEWSKIDSIENEDAYDRKLEKFYQKYQEQFVTDYAPTSPEEDIAESWAYFILKPKPAAKTTADQKVLFFYKFPELTKLRELIAHNLCDQLEK